MKWSKSIAFTEPLRGVHQLAGAPGQDWEGLLRQREQAAYERGRGEGEAAANRRWAEQHAQLADLHHAVLESLRGAVPQVVREAETALMRLALEAARKVVASLPVNAELVEAVVREALREAEDTAEVVVQLHPDDLALLREQSPVRPEGPEGPLRLCASPEVTRGGCLVQTRFGLIDARRETKWERMQQDLSL